MPGKKILHVVGGVVSPWVVRQLAVQLSVLPEARFGQTIAAAEVSTVRQLEHQLVRRVIRLNKRLGSDELAALTLRQVERELRPELIVCWDVAGLEQLGLARVGGKRRMNALLMLFSMPSSAEISTIREVIRHRVDVRVVASSEVIAESVRAQWELPERVHRVWPANALGMGYVSRCAVRGQMGLSEEAVVALVPGTGSVQDRIHSIWAAALVQRIYPGVRVLMPVFAVGEGTLRRYRRFAGQLVSEDFVLTTDRWAVGLALLASDVFVDPTTVGGETLGVESAFAGGIPAVVTPAIRESLGREASELAMVVDRKNPRWLASAMLSMIEDETLRAGLTTRAKAWVADRGSRARYRADLVKLFREMKIGDRR